MRRSIQFVKKLGSALKGLWRMRAHTSIDIDDDVAVASSALSLNYETSSSTTETMTDNATTATSETNDEFAGGSISWLAPGGRWVSELPGTTILCRFIVICCFGFLDLLVIAAKQLMFS